MTNIKQLFINRFKTLSLITTTIVFCFILLMIRIKITHSFFYIFLVWNLFLASVPFAISMYVMSIKKRSIWSCLFWFCVWILFLPNAPYIVTDLLHIKVGTKHLLWIDVLVVFAFALSGLLFFFFSIEDMKRIINQFIPQKHTNYIIGSILYLSGFGVYLGRFLRYNSWEIIENPLPLCNAIINIIISPKTHYEAWLFTILFGTFLSIGYWIFNRIKSLETNT